MTTHSNPLDFGFKGNWKRGNRRALVEVEWLHPWKLTGDKGFVGMFGDAERAGISVLVEGIPFRCDRWDPISVRGFAERLLHLTEQHGAWPELVGDRDRYLFPKVEENPRGLRKRWVSYPSSEQIAGSDPLPR